MPLLGPVADTLGIDLIWFGVLLAVNMQTSFMHPPFGFALFYLRSVAPKHEYVDESLSGKSMAPVTTGQIYWGAIPFVIIQVIMVGLVIVFPDMVLIYKKDASTVDPNSIEMSIPTEGESGGGAPPAEGGSGLQNYAPVPDQGYGSRAPADTAPPPDDASKSMQDAFKAPAPEDAKK